MKISMLFCFTCALFGVGRFFAYANYDDCVADLNLLQQARGRYEKILYSEIQAHISRRLQQYDREVRTGFVDDRTFYADRLLDDLTEMCTRREADIKRAISGVKHEPKSNPRDTLV